MRIDVLFGSLLFLVAALDASAARAGSDGCCTTAPFPNVILPPGPFVAPPIGYVLNSSDPTRPFYVVNRGPQLPSLGAAARARPTYPEDGYAFDAEYPYIVSSGSGGHYGYRAFRHAPAFDAFVRRSGVRPYTAYRYDR